MVQAILFDLGDTLFTPDWVALDAAMRKETGVSIIMNIEAKRFYEDVLVGKKTIQDAIILLINQAGITADPKEIASIYKKNYEKYSPIDKRITDLIDSLRIKIKVYALSNTNQIHKEVNESRGVFDHFDRVFLSCEIGIKKPDPNIFKLIIDFIKLKPNEVIFVDDNEKNVKNARELGILGIVYKGYDKLVKDLNELGLY